MLSPLRIFTVIVLFVNCSIFILVQDFRVKKHNDNSAHHSANTIKDPASEHYSVVEEGRVVKKWVEDEPEDQINEQRNLLLQKLDINGIVDAGSLKKSVLEELKNIQSKIFETWGEERESFFTSLQFGNSHTREETRHYVKRKMMKAFAEQGTFTITTLGTSVAASHDGRYNQSFTAVLEQTLKPIFTNLGVDLVVSNHAMGANPVNPMHYCVGTLGDLNTDLYLYEFGMMISGHAQEHFENFLRSAISQPNQPIVTFLQANAHKTNINIRPPALFPGFGDNYLGKNNQMQQHYRGFGINYWSFIAAVVVNGAQNDTHFQEEYCISDKPFNKHKPWHPGPHGHEAVGMALAYSYALVFADAVQSVLELKDSGHHIDPKVLDNPRATLPEAYTGPCKSDPFCVSPNTTCYTSFEPKGEANMDLGNFVMNADYEDTRPTLPTPCGQPEGQTCLKYKGLENWVMGIWPQDEKAVMEGIYYGADYADRKWTLLGRNTSGELELELEAPRSGNQFMYCHPSGDFGKYPPEIQGAAQNYIVKVNGTQVQQVSTGAMCAIVKTKIEPGKIKMAFQAPDEKLVAISHIVFP